MDSPLPTSHPTVRSGTSRNRWSPASTRLSLLARIGAEEQRSNRFPSLYRSRVSGAVACRFACSNDSGDNGRLHGVGPCAELLFSGSLSAGGSGNEQERLQSQVGVQPVFFRPG